MISVSGCMTLEAFFPVDITSVKNNRAANGQKG
jgi:hypothetical protein